MIFKPMSLLGSGITRTTWLTPLSLHRSIARVMRDSQAGSIESIRLKSASSRNPGCSPDSNAPTVASLRRASSASTWPTKLIRSNWFGGSAFASIITRSCSLPGGTFLHADLFEERFERSLAAQEFFYRHVHVARIADFVNLLAQPHPGCAIEVTIRRVLEHRGHVRRDRVRPRVAV